MTNICNLDYNKCHQKCSQNDIKYHTTLTKIFSVVTPTYHSEEENEEQTYDDDPNQTNDKERNNPKP